MKRAIDLFSVIALVLLFGLATSAQAQNVSRAGAIPAPSMPRVSININPVNPGVGMVIHPQSSQPQPAGTKLQAHSNVEFFLPAKGLPKPYEAPPFSGYGFETPASLGCIYNLVATIAGCNPNSTTSNPTGGSNTIAIVDAYDDPYAAEDLAWFSLNFGIPFSPSQFQLVWASNGFVPEDDSGGWELEESLDIEYAHAMAPGAKIYLVEAASNYGGDLAEAINVATNLVLCGHTNSCSPSSTGTGEVSMSWGTGEWPGETLSGAGVCTATDGTQWYCSDTIFTTNNGTFTGGSGPGNSINGVVYFAASGDYPGTSWPCVSPYVVCVGGTSTARNPSTLNFIQEVSWPDGGGGASFYEPFPSYQVGVTSIGETSNRAVPDVSADANPYTGVWIYDSYPYYAYNGEVYFAGWEPVGGTSAATPIWAGIVNQAGHFAASSNAELTTMYANRAAGLGDYNKIVSGWCGPYSGFATTGGWNFCGGIGSDKGLSGK